MDVKKFTEKEFLSLKPDWEKLLDESGADPLFLSWDWMYRWWEFNKNSSYELLLLGIFKGNALACLAPLYINTHKNKANLTIRTIELLGASHISNKGFLSEYLQFICLPDAQDQCIESVANFLLKTVKHDEIRLGNVIEESKTCNILTSFCNHKKYLVRQLEDLTSYGINSKPDFDDYTSRLGKNSRLQLLNRRKVLDSLGSLEIKKVTAENFYNALDILSQFNATRWGANTDFSVHKAFITKLIESSEISVDGVMVFLDSRPIGCTLNLSNKGRRYNFQLGFKENVNKKISMGSLTLGFDIENSCNDTSIHYFDLMGGEGKNTNYKTRFAQPETTLKNLQLIKNPILKILYRLNDWKKRSKAI